MPRSKIKVSKPTKVAHDIERVIAIDWSGDKGPGQRKKIWAGTWTASTGRIGLENGRTREEIVDWLIQLAQQTPRMAVSIDCCFSFPAWFLAEHHCTSVFDFWQHVADGHGERWLTRQSADTPGFDPRFWGAPHKRPAHFSGEFLHHSMRRTDLENKILPFAPIGSPGHDPLRAAKMVGITAKSPFQIGGSGSVGTGSLRAMPSLLRLKAAGFRIWPFDDAALDGKSPAPLVVEMYTRLMTGPVKKSNELARRAYLAAKRADDPAYAALSRTVLAKACGSEDAFDALVSTLVMVEHRSDFSRLRRTFDPLYSLEGETWRPGVQAPGSAS